MKPKFSIVIPTRNRPELALRAIQSVLAQVDTKDYEIIVADNSDLDHRIMTELDFVEILLDHPNIHVLGSPKIPLPMWDNWKMGAELAKGEWVIMLPDKCILSPYALGHLANTIASNSQAKFVTWKVHFAYSWIPNVTSRYSEQLITFADARRRFLEFDMTNNDWWPHGMNTCYRRFDGHEKMYRPSCPDYQAGFALTKGSGFYLHTTDDIMYIPRDSKIEHSTGTQFTRGIPTKATIEFVQQLPSNYSNLIDWSFPLEYVLRDYGIFDPPARFLLAAYYRHVFDRWRLGGGWSYKYKVHDGSAFLLALWRLGRDMVRRLM